MGLRVQCGDWIGEVGKRVGLGVETEGGTEG
jgi:hypothetical protein